MSKHTPAPWSIEREHELKTAERAQYPFHIFGTNDELVCAVSTKVDGDVIAANARLIAASPLLLEAIEQIEDQLLRVEERMDKVRRKFRSLNGDIACDDVHMEIDEIRSLCQKAIAKATGGDHE